MLALYYFGLASLVIGFVFSIAGLPYAAWLNRYSRQPLWWLFMIMLLALATTSSALRKQLQQTTFALLFWAGASISFAATIAILKRWI